MLLMPVCTISISVSGYGAYYLLSLIGAEFSLRFVFRVEIRVKFKLEVETEGK